MTGSYRKLGLALAALLITAPTALAQDVNETFKQAVDLLERDRKEEALRMFQKVLALEPSSEQAFEIWKATSHDVWLEILREGGEIELIGKRLSALVDVARAARKDDAGAIRGLIGEMRTDDPIARRKAIRQLAADHGEHAVPYLLGWLGDTANEENRTTAHQALTEMNTDVVLPLLEVLRTDDAFLRRNAVMVLATIGDRRAAGALAAVAKSDSDSAAKNTAAGALARLGSSGDAARDWCDLGDAYHMRSTEVLAEHQWSTVVWNWTDGKLVSTQTPAALYADALARKAYLRALAVDSTHAAAHAGLARAHAGTVASVAAMEASGADISGWTATRDSADVALGLAGAGALDAGLAKSLNTNDAAAAVVLVRTLAEVAPAPTAALQAALKAKDGAVRSEAAVALGNMATWGKTRASADLVAALGAVAGRDVLRLAFVIDGDAARNASVSDALSKGGMSVTSAASAVMGLTTLRRMAGLDAVVIADTLPDLTASQVIAEIRAETAFGKAPIFLVSANPEAAREAFGETVTGVLDNAADVSAVSAAIAGSEGADRKRAEALAAQASQLLATLAGTGTDISAATASLASALGRGDTIAVPAAYALCSAGTGDHVAALAAAVGDSARSEEVRVAAGHALASIFGRGGAAGGAADGLTAVVHSDAPVAVRRVAAQALGNLALSAQERWSHLSGGPKPQN